jgi:hypothetical protein
MCTSSDQAKMAVWTLVAPLGELPEEEAVEAIAEALRQKEEGYRRRKLPHGSLRWWRYKDPLWYVLHRVRGKEGVLSDQVDGGWVSKWYVYRFGPAETSVLAAAGVHAERSVFVLRYERTQTASTGRAPALTEELEAKLKDIPEARAELEVLEKRLSERYGLEGALREARNRRGGLPLFVDAIRRGHFLFLLEPTRQATHTLLGGTLFPLAKSRYPYSVKYTTEETLVRFLRENSRLGNLPPRTVRGLLRGEGDPEEAARRANLAHLASL